MKKLSKQYNPQEFEDKIYRQWEESGYFNPDNLSLPEDALPYTIILPPPNITDKLHLGHSSMLAIEDLLIRFHRMKGYRTLWLPGTDHAAIATQNVVERKLFKETGKNRHDLGREKFLEKVWEFLKETQSTILKQTRKMGASLDWSREAFTLDEQRQKAVAQMFVDMYKAGAIYRGERIVNWCPRCHSTLADDEVEHREQKAKLYTFKYWADFPISISTTRPETKPGDTAVAVNPKDKRYQKFIGKEFSGKFCGLPLKVKVIADREVDMNFGTGALGVTPAHSMVDWKMAENNNLEIKKVIDENGKIYSGYGKFSGLSAGEAGKLIIEELRQQDLIEKEEEIDNALSVCYRCDTAIEPLPSKQWFVAVDKKLERLGGKSLKEKAIEVARRKQISFIPHRFEKRYIDWMENLHDWCISRQIWFGHRIPVWYKKNDNENIYVNTTPPKDIKNWTQDSDVLDTWFSSGMWTFSTLGWPSTFQNGKKTGDLAKFHPTQVLETGYEILTLWVSRMIMMSLFAVGEIPFENVYLHGMVLDEHGKKMSKSKGNGIDPTDVIAEFGTDAVRLALLIGNTPGNNLRIGKEKIEGFRNFVNKLWNISRYILSSTDEKPRQSFDEILTSDKADLTLADKWILNKFYNLVAEVGTDIENYKFSEAGEKLRDFTWGDFADWYLEVSKFEKNRPEKEIILREILRDLLKLWHPFIPFVTEAIWQKTVSDKKLLMVEKWPKREKYSFKNSTANSFELIKKIIVAIRNARAENKIETGKKIKAIIYAGDNLSFLQKAKILLENLRTGIKDLEIKKTGDKIADAIYIKEGAVEIYLLGGIDKNKEQQRLKKEIAELDKYIAGLKNKLSNKNFKTKAPREIVDREENKLEDAQNKKEKLETYLSKLR